MLLDTVRNFKFFVPPVIEFGCKVRNRTSSYAKRLKIEKALVIADPYFVDTELYHEITQAMNNDGIETVSWSGVVPNPTDVSVDEATQVYRGGGCNGVVAIGGGSSLDTAKGVAVMARSDAKSMREYTPPQWRPVDGMAPTILLPTTAGTGAEVNPWAMITNTATGKKDVGYDASNFVAAQRVAIVDPDLTVSMPPMLTATTGMDAVCQVLECYLSDTTNPVSDSIALHAIEVAAGNLREAVRDGSNIEARTGMSLVSMMSTLAFPNAGLSYPHQLSAPLYDKWGVAHGVAVAITTKASMEVLLPEKTHRLARIAGAMGVDSKGLNERQLAERGIEAVAELIQDIGLPTFKMATGASADEVDDFVEELRKSPPKQTTPIERYEWILKRSLGV